MTQYRSKPVSGPSVVDSQMKFGKDNYYKTWGNKDNNQQRNRDKNKNKNQQKNHSELSIAVSELCSSPRDFSIADFFRNIKEKLFPKLNNVPKEDAAKAVLEGSFEFLEENGYDGYTVLINILNSHMGKGNFSESSPSLVLWNSLSDGQKEAFYNALQIACGTEPARAYMETLQTDSPPSPYRLTFLKALGVLGIAYGILRFISSPVSRGVKRPEI